MNDREKLVGMLAVANFRYSLTVSNDGCAVNVMGKRDANPGKASNIQFDFDAVGALKNITTEWT